MIGGGEQAFPRWRQTKSSFVICGEQPSPNTDLHTLFAICDAGKAAEEKPYNLFYIEHLSCCGLTRTTSACWQIQSFGRPAEPAFVIFPTWRSGWYQTVAFAFIWFDRLEVCSIQLRQSEYIMSWSNQFVGQQEGGGGAWWITLEA